MKRAAADVSVDIGIALSGRVNGERIRRYPPLQRRRVEALAKVLEPYLDIVFLPREAVVFAEAFPSIRAVVALGRAVGLIGGALDEFAGGFVEDDACRWGAPPAVVRWG